MKNLIAPDVRYTKTYGTYERAEKEGRGRCVGIYEDVLFVIAAVKTEKGIRFTPVFTGGKFHLDFAFTGFAVT